ncbi:MAG: SLBB domain-containing protein [Nitrospira sp.]|nr:SLBB domain-containing protein [Nitrospira sp.]
MKPSAMSLSPEQMKRGNELLQQQQGTEQEQVKIQNSIPAKPLKTEQPSNNISEKKSSTFEDYIQSKNPPTVLTDINQFGYDLFDQPPSTFAQADTVPVGPDYLLGPGDELRLTIWGKLNAEYSVIIDQEGKINLPQIGILYISGRSFKEARDSVEKEFAHFYNPQEVKINVSTGRLRSIRVFIVGRAQKPGSYTLSSLSTLVNALFAAGGPGKNGTLRDIQVKRSGNTIVHFDMYDFLLKGDKTKDIRIMPEDVIFIPPIGPLAGIAGNVNTPAIYELKGETQLSSLVEMAGGLNDIALKGRIQIERIINNSQQIVLESNLDELKLADIKIQPGDLIKIYPVIQNKRTVTLAGAVYGEGEYGFSAGMTVKDLLNLAGGLKYYAYTKESELFRSTTTQEGVRTEKHSINLEKALEGNTNHNLLLKENDYLFIKNLPEWETRKTVTINGEVLFPGNYAIEKGETLSSLIKRAGGYTDKAYLKGATFTRESVKTLQQRQINESLDILEQQLLSQSARTVETALTPEEAVQQKAVAEQKTALLIKMRAAKAKGRVSIRLDRLDRFTGSSSDVILENNDTLTIPEKPQQIQVIGSVYNQTAFVYEPESDVASYIAKSGGMTKDADKDQLYVLKIDGTAVSKRTNGSLMSSWEMLDPGDTIVVPEKIEKIAWLREIKDFTQILYQIAVTAGVLILRF